MNAKHICNALITALIFWSSLGFAQQPGSEDTLVSQFFPASLSNNTESNMRLYAYADADLAGTGNADYIVAAYSNGESGAVLVLKKQGASAAVAATPSFPRMGGIYPSVEMRDVDADGYPEAIVGFTTGSGFGDVTWVLKWNGTTLQSIGPVVTDAGGLIDTVLNDPLFVNFSGGGGPLDMIAPDVKDAPVGEDNIPLWYAVYTLSGGKYIKAGTLDFFETFRREKGTPVEKSAQFSVQDVKADYVLTIINGAGTDNLVSSAKVALNGVIVADQNDFNQNVRVIKIPVTMSQDNTLSVKLFGAPGSLVSVGIGPK